MDGNDVILALFQFVYPALVQIRVLEVLSTFRGLTVGITQIAGEGFGEEVVFSVPFSLEDQGLELHVVVVMRLDGQRHGFTIF